MAKIGDKEKQARALREALLNSSRGGVESGHTHLVANIGCGRSGDVRPGPPASGTAAPITGVTPSPREAKSKSSDAARTIPVRKPKPAKRFPEALIAASVPKSKVPKAKPAESKVGRPRIEDRDKTLKARKPWIALDMSRSTWFRRQAEKKAKTSA